eukprot:2589439-Prymnesium_polylepis.1
MAALRASRVEFARAVSERARLCCPHMSRSRRSGYRSRRRPMRRTRGRLIDTDQCLCALWQQR